MDLGSIAHRIAKVGAASRATAAQLLSEVGLHPDGDQDGAPAGRLNDRDRAELARLLDDVRSALTNDE